MAFTMYLKLDNIKGEAEDAGLHNGEIEVLTWSWGLAYSGATHPTQGAAAGKATASDLSLTKWVDRASVPLFMAMAGGTRIPTAVLTFVKFSKRNEPLDFLVMQMKNVYITSQSDGGSSTKDRLTENISLNFSDIAIRYVMMNPDGTVGPTYQDSWAIYPFK